MYSVQCKNRIDNCKYDEVQKADDHGCKIQFLDFGIQVLLLGFQVQRLLFVFHFLADFFQEEDESIFKQRNQNWNLSSNHPDLNVAKPPTLWSFHRVVDVSGDQVECQNHSHSSRNLLRILIKKSLEFLIENIKQQTYYVWIDQI